VGQLKNDRKSCLVNGTRAEREVVAAFAHGKTSHLHVAPEAALFHLAAMRA
jgi:hypothetical protein